MKDEANWVQAARASAVRSGGGGTVAGGGWREQPLTMSRANKAAQPPWRILDLMITSLETDVYLNTWATSGYSCINTSCALAVSSGSRPAATAAWPVPVTT